MRTLNFVPWTLISNPSTSTVKGRSESLATSKNPSPRSFTRRSPAAKRASQVSVDPPWSQTVEVEGLEISVHGTKFNVRTAADRYVSVSLVEGSVSLDTGRGSRRLLRPGEIACYDPDTRKVVIGRGNVAMESCWAAGKLAFERQSLGEICHYMARWYDTEIHITPALAHNYAYTFTITDEPLEEILRIMSRINPIAYTFAEDNTVTISELE